MLELTGCQFTDIFQYGNEHRVACDKSKSETFYFLVTLLKGWEFSYHINGNMSCREGEARSEKGLGGGGADRNSADANRNRAVLW